jgi:DNA-binding response OmpR family regulator
MSAEADVARILIIEDDPIEAKDEASQLQRAGYDVRIAFTGRDGLRLLEEYRPDVVLLGLALPDIWGLDLCATIAQTSDAYILLTSGYSAEDIKSTGLELGADDLLMRPFPSEELLARVNAFLRRRDRAHRLATPRVQYGDMMLVRERQTIEHEAGASADLTQLEFALLEYLIDADGRLLTRAQILERVWHDVSGVATRVVDVHVGSLRKKLGEVGSEVRISSVRGIGYRLDEG